MITLGGVELNRSLQWVDRYRSYQIAQSMRYTRGGNIRLYQQRLYTGRRITLVADESTGWFTNPMRVAVLDLCSQIDQTFAFYFFGEDYEVVFDHTEVAAEFEKIIYRQVPEDEDVFMGTVRLITV